MRGLVKWLMVCGIAVGEVALTPVTAIRAEEPPAEGARSVRTVQYAQSAGAGRLMSQDHVSRPIQEIAPTVAASSEGKLPDELPVPRRGEIDRTWEEQVFNWEASQLHHYPLYFEDLPVERYGHSLGLLQPVWSAGQFYGNLLLLPYEAGMNPPFRRVYSLGHHRPGDRVPRLWYQVPVSVQGAAAAATTWTLVPVIYP